VWAGRIDELFISLVPASYAPDSPDTQIGESPATVTLSNISVTGPNAHLPMEMTGVAAHDVRMTDGFDNAYPLSPERIVSQVHRLGYRDWYVLYMGVSKFHSLSWDPGEARYVVDPLKPALNFAAAAWLEDFFARLHTAGFRIILSVSFEILTAWMPFAWMQRDHTSNPAQTGWQPSSSLIAPTNADGLAYLRGVFLALIDLLPAGAEVHFQVGEPWWWDGSFGSRAPHIYDFGTLTKYNDETGLFAPTPWLETVAGQPDPIHDHYLAWCRDQLGNATAWLVDQVKAAHPDATSYLLIFTPQILRDDAPMLWRLNFPQAAWSYPAFDVLQLEDYDWVMAGDFAKNALSWKLVKEVMGYPPEALHYFSGFTLRPEQTWIWQHSDEALWLARAQAPAEVFIWSREQVGRDGWMADRQWEKIYPRLTRLATCWRIQRTDGQVEGYTTHDRPLTIDGTVYDPATGFSPSQLSGDADMSVADVELLGAVSSDSISDEALIAGVYDHAEVVLFVVDWGDLSTPATIIRRGWIGRVSQAGNRFNAELRGIAQKIQAPIIDSYSAECRVDLYSRPCGVNRAAHTMSAAVTAVTDGSLGASADMRTFTAAALTRPDGYFDYGHLEWTSGANTGRRADVRSFAGGVVELWESAGLPIAVGDSFDISAGCDKRIGTCIAKFDNVLNFRGEPHVPGSDFLLGYAS